MKLNPEQAKMLKRLTKLRRELGGDDFEEKYKALATYAWECYDAGIPKMQIGTIALFTDRNRTNQIIAEGTPNPTEQNQEELMRKLRYTQEIRDAVARGEI